MKENRKMKKSTISYYIIELVEGKGSNKEPSYLVLGMNEKKTTNLV